MTFSIYQSYGSILKNRVLELAVREAFEYENTIARRYRCYEESGGNDMGVQHALNE